MITREEAIIKLDYTECIFKDKKIYINGVCTEQLLNEIYDSFEQHIKSLEAQLTHTEQLTCDKCLFWKDYRKCPMADYENVAPKNYCYNFYSKDTQ